MKVVNIISGKDLGGPKQSFIDYGTMLTNLGLEVHYIVRPKAKCLEYLSHIPSKQVHIINYYRSNIKFIKKHSIKKLTKTLNLIEPKIIFAHKQFDLSLLKPAYPQAYLIGIIHGFNAKHTNNADQLIAVSSAVTNWLKNKTKAPCLTIANTVSLPKQEIAKKNKTITIGTMAVFRRKKQINHLIKAASILKKQGLNFNIIIAGRGFRKHWFLLLLKYYKLTNQIKIEPWVKNKQAFFSKIDIFCITSKTESFNISLIESMAHKVCVISSKCGGPEDIINHDINGVLYANNSIEELSEKLYMLIRHQEKREKLALAGFDKVCKNFAMPIIEKKLQMIILRVL